MATFTRTYSRGNDDPNENSYETAKIEVTIEADTTDCKMRPPREDSEEKPKCRGVVVTKLSYKAVSSTTDRMFQQLGAQFELFVPLTGGRQQLVFKPGPGPAGPPPPGAPPVMLGSTFEATLETGVMSCRGQQLKGSAEIRFAPGGGVPGPTVETVDYDIVITPCGVVTKLDVTVSEKMIRPGGVNTPLIDITPPAGAGAPLAPYPAPPGVPRTP